MSISNVSLIFSTIRFTYSLSIFILSRYFLSLSLHLSFFCISLLAYSLLYLSQFVHIFYHSFLVPSFPLLSQTYTANPIFIIPISKVSLIFSSIRFTYSLSIFILSRYFLSWSLHLSFICISFLAYSLLSLSVCAYFHCFLVLSFPYFKLNTVNPILIILSMSTLHAILQSNFHSVHFFVFIFILVIFHGGLFF